MTEFVRQPIADLAQYENRWVAIHETETGRKIVGSGADAVAALRYAERHGYTGVMLQRVFPADVLYVPAT